MFFIILKVTSDQIEAVKAQFKKFDLNNDGKLSRKEYYIMLQKDKKHLNQTHIYCFVIMKNAINYSDLKFTYSFST